MIIESVEAISRGMVVAIRPLTPSSTSGNEIFIVNKTHGDYVVGTLIVFDVDIAGERDIVIDLGLIELDGVVSVMTHLIYTFNRDQIKTILGTVKDDVQMEMERCIYEEPSDLFTHGLAYFYGNYDRRYKHVRSLSAYLQCNFSADENYLARLGLTSDLIEFIKHRIDNSPERIKQIMEAASLPLADLKSRDAQRSRTDLDIISQMSISGPHLDKLMEEMNYG